MTQYSDKSRSKFHDILKQVKFTMKTSNKPNPSKSQLISWFNSCLPSNIQKITAIEQLGNGAAYLHILNCLRPGSVRIERINNSAKVLYDIKNNLRMLVTAFEKQKLGYSMDIDKLAQKKYQDNYHLAVFLYHLRNKQMKKTESKEEINQKQEASSYKMKIKLPQQPISIHINKFNPPPLDKQAFEKLKLRSQRHLEKSEPHSSIKQQQKSIKVDKIASVLKLSIKDPKEKEKTQFNRRSSEKQTHTMQQTYTRFLRSSVCKRSKYLNNQGPNQHIPANSADNSIINEHNLSTNHLKSSSNIYGTQQDNELLLSDQKVENLKEELQTTGQGGFQLTQIEKQRIIVNQKEGEE